MRRRSGSLSRLLRYCYYFLLTSLCLPTSCLATSNPELPASNGALYDFDRMSGLVKRLDAIELTAPETILGFYEPRLRSFSVKPELAPAGVKRVCVTSTCYALLTVILSSGIYENILSNTESGSSPTTKTDTGEGGKDDPVVIPIRLVMKTLLKSQWREDDLFQVPLVLYTLLILNQDHSSIIRFVASDERIANRIQKMISVILQACPDPRLGTRQPNSDYITYQICKVSALLYEASLKTEQQQQQLQKQQTDDSTDAGTMSWKSEFPIQLLPEGGAAEIYSALLACAEVSSNELCRQLAYHAAGDTNSFDIIRLAYSLLTWIRCTQTLSGGTTAGEIAPGEGLSSDILQVPKLNKKLVAAALDVFFAEQNKDGLWQKGQPIYKDFRRNDRNLENAFVFPVNTLGSLLCSLPAESFRPYLGALERTLTWIENHQTFEMITDYCDPVTGQCYGKPLRGWCAPHTSGNDTPQVWPTAQVLKCVSWIRKTIKQLQHNDVLEEFNGISFSNSHNLVSSWDRLLDSDLGDPSQEGRRTLKSVLEERVIKPFANSIDTPSYGAAYSAILFGPPGTAKTSICENLAERMGWDFCVIDTASFLADGLSNVAARIRYVFSRLMALDSAVILFDEIEEFGLDRETPGLSMESRMLTTAMLTAINDLRRNKRSVFFIATNRLRAFDAAITRRGRFDMQLFVGTPNLASRIVQFQQRLTGLGLSKDEKRAALQVYQDYLKEVWKQDAMYMTYLEGAQFATTCARIVAAKKKLEPRELAMIMKQQSAVMTVRSSVREEYLQSMGLSRL